MSLRSKVQTWVEASLFRYKNNLLYQYPEKIVIRPDRTFGSSLDIYWILFWISKRTISTSSGYPEDDRCYLGRHVKREEKGRKGGIVRSLAASTVFHCHEFPFVKVFLP